MIKDNQIIICPICDEDFACCHMIRTWVIGSSIIALDGKQSFEDESLTRLFPVLEAGRGSKVVILFMNELCNHKWFNVKEFHKGCSFETDIELTEEEKTKERISLAQDMWRD